MKFEMTEKESLEFYIRREINSLSIKQLESTLEFITAFFTGRENANKAEINE